MSLLSLLSRRRRLGHSPYARATYQKKTLIFIMYITCVGWLGEGASAPPTIGTIGTIASSAGWPDAGLIGREW